MKEGRPEGDGPLPSISPSGFTAKVAGKVFKVPREKKKEAPAPDDHACGAAARGEWGAALTGKLQWERQS